MLGAPAKSKLISGTPEPQRAPSSLNPGKGASASVPRFKQHLRTPSKSPGHSLQWPACLDALVLHEEKQVEGLYGVGEASRAKLALLRM